MATNAADRRELLMPTKYQDRETNPERTKMLNLPKSKSEQKVGVVYYLTRNGQFEHPHFMEVPLSSPQGLQLKAAQATTPNSPVIRRKNRSWTPFDELDEYKDLTGPGITGEIASKGTSNVSTRATDKRRVSIDGNEEVGA
uniref:SOSEKI DIX-like domain-containing protein n=1 Tax=Populus alba TaxID=43335 RepID=A0A4U5R006_POPAL|nr:hypothetical protein D5086_0000016750 [Populus alba]